MGTASIVQVEPSLGHSGGPSGSEYKKGFNFFRAFRVIIVLNYFEGPGLYYYYLNLKIITRILSDPTIPNGEAEIPLQVKWV